MLLTSSAAYMAERVITIERRSLNCARKLYSMSRLSNQVSLTKLQLTVGLIWSCGIAYTFFCLVWLEHDAHKLYSENSNIILYCAVTNELIMNTNKFTGVKNTFLHIIHQYSDMFRSSLDHLQRVLRLRSIYKMEMNY